MPEFIHFDDYIIPKSAIRLISTQANEDGRDGLHIRIELPHRDIRLGESRGWGTSDVESHLGRLLEVLNQ